VLPKQPRIASTGEKSRCGLVVDIVGSRVIVWIPDNTHVLTDGVVFLSSGLFNPWFPK
jgi:hypothetical protein